MHHILSRLSKPNEILSSICGYKNWSSENESQHWKPEDLTRLNLAGAQARKNSIHNNNRSNNNTININRNSDNIAGKCSAEGFEYYASSSSLSLASFCFTYFKRLSGRKRMRERESWWLIGGGSSQWFVLVYNASRGWLPRLLDDHGEGCWCHRHGATTCVHSRPGPSQPKPSPGSAWKASQMLSGYHLTFDPNFSFN